MAETFDPHCVWFVGARSGRSRTDYSQRLPSATAGAGSDLRRVADQHRATGLLSATGGVPRQRRAASGADPRPDGGGGEGGKNGGASADGRRLAIWLGARAGRRADPPRDPLAGGAGRQRFPRRGGGAGGGVHGTRSLAESDYYPSGRAHARFPRANSWKPLPAIKPRWRFTCRCNVFTGWRSGWWRAATPRPPRSR